MFKIYKIHNKAELAIAIRKGLTTPYIAKDPKVVEKYPVWVYTQGYNYRWLEDLYGPISNELRVSCIKEYVKLCI